MEALDPDQAHSYLTGRADLPAGAVPLAITKHRMSCVIPGGRLVWWIPTHLKIAPVSASDEPSVMDAIVRALGGTAATAAERLGVSRRTVEGWRCGRRALSCSAAYLILTTLAEQPDSGPVQKRD